ncbi:hypothetical protein K491DRAFT_675947 [Lophiostoma macrostomum CBS 122681]|uniref:Myb-like domain-containing protein n=1 Tax=Lophiostoma macrostomum CBS 122681 TaxID=1314788 RepID=A0A6A6TJ82_9PLEO|nr:hypothetical protein K491DRAFT_675947 [Lophiostoma macrostomum CBS 122681]
MPMSWTPENDRLLLLKLIETHGIKVDIAKIEKAWPKTANPKPTARAITERFAKLRQLAGINISLSTSKSGGGKTQARVTASAAKPFSTPTSAAKKRKAKAKAKNEDEDESDGEGHMTLSEDEDVDVDEDEDETPTKQKQKQTPNKARKMGVGRTPRSGRAGSSLGGGLSLSNEFGRAEEELEFEDGDEDPDFGFQTGRGVRVKNANQPSHPTEPTDDHDPFTSNGPFAADIAEARRLRDMTSHSSASAQPSNRSLGLGFMTSPYNNASFGNGMAHFPNYGISGYGTGPGTPGAMDGGNDAMFMNAFGAGGSLNGQGISPMTAMNAMSAQMAGIGNRMNMGGGGGSGVSTGMGTGMGAGMGHGMGMTQYTTNTGLTPHTSRMHLSNSSSSIPSPIPFAAPPKKNTVSGNNSGNGSTSPSASASRDRTVSATPSVPSRARSARQVSQKAAEKMSAYIQAAKEEEKANGEASSVEDSAASEFEGSDGDEVMV